MRAGERKQGMTGTASFIIELVVWSIKLCGADKLTKGLTAKSPTLIYLFLNFLAWNYTAFFRDYCHDTLWLNIYALFVSSMTQ